MNCRKSIHMIGLDSELTAHEQRRLQSHLRTCAACQLEWQRQMKFRQTIDLLRQEPPPLTHPEVMLRRIMGAVGDEPAAIVAKHPRIHSYNLNRIRPVFAGIILLCINVFVLQEAWIGYRLWRLEEQTLRQPPPRSSRENFTGHSPALLRLFTPAELKQISNVLAGQPGQLTKNLRRHALVLNEQDGRFPPFRRMARINMKTGQSALNGFRLHPYWMAILNKAASAVLTNQ